MNKKFFITVCLLLAGLMLSPCYGQQQNRSRKAKEPEVPKMALLPSVSKDFFEKRVNAYLDWVDSLADAPATVREYGSNPRKYKFMSASEIRQKILEYKSLVQHPDLEEVTGHARGWYVRIYNASLPLIKAADLIQSMRSVPSAQKYNAARGMLHDAMNAVLDISEKTKPEKMARRDLVAVIKQNQERRKKEWLKWYYADQKRKQLEAKSGKKENKKVTKKDDRNDKDRSSRKDRKRKESAR
jgi:hypothetical protein